MPKGILMQLHDRVELTHDVDEWPAGTSGTIVDDEAEGILTIELVGPDGRTLALLDIEPADVTPLEPHVRFATA